jgi:hypothetical protein
MSFTNPSLLTVDEDEFIQHRVRGQLGHTPTFRTLPLTMSARYFSKLLLLIFSADQGRSIVSINTVSEYNARSIALRRMAFPSFLLLERYRVSWSLLEDSSRTIYGLQSSASHGQTVSSPTPLVVFLVLSQSDNRNNK